MDLTLSIRFKRDENLKLNKENSDGSGYLCEEHGTSSSLQILHPTAFSFKEGGVLTNHPPSCHPRRLFGCPENEKENERKGRERRKAGKRGEKWAESFSAPKLY